ncbi:MAG TPA: metallophosphoesterase [Vicinamibacteria bacterium]|nr:metallophosphoesterase [Vicinamibacteria bacterium]
MRHARVLFVAAMAASLAVGGATARPAAVLAEEAWPSVERVLAVGDVHGDLEPLLALLRAGGVLDERGRWSGGRTHLVQTGDRVDRGPDSRKVMDLLMRLQKEARKAKGMVHPLTGNHEAMNLLGDLRYVIPEEFAAFRTPDSSRLRDALWERLRAASPQPLGVAERERFDREHPLGWVEHRRAWAPSGRYGGWVARQNAVIRVGDTLFLHGGLSPKYADFSLRDLDARIQDELEEADPATALVTNDPDGPLWYRGLAREDPALEPHLEAVLRTHGCRRMVIGHTVTEGLILPLFRGRVVMIDVGLSKAYGGPPAALLLENGRAFALHRGHRIALPEADGEPMLAYVRAVMALEPDPTRLQPLLGRLESALSAPPPTR